MVVRRCSIAAFAVFAFGGAACAVDTEDAELRDAEVQALLETVAVELDEAAQPDLLAEGPPESLADVVEAIDPDTDIDLDDPALDELVDVSVVEDLDPSTMRPFGPDTITELWGAEQLYGGIDIPIAAGQTACATQSLADPEVGATIAMSPDPTCGYVTDEAASPAGIQPFTYGSTQCPAQFVTEASSVFGRGLAFTFRPITRDGPGQPAAMSITQQMCPNMRADATVWGAWLNLYPPGIKWSKFAQAHYHGQWINIGFGSSCWMLLDEGSNLPTLQDDHFFFKVRIAARVYEFIDNVAWTWRTAAGVRHGTTCP